MAFKTEYTAMATLLAAVSGLIFAVVIWFVLTKFLSLENGIAVAIAFVIGGAESVALRYVLSQKYISSDDET